MGSGQDEEGLGPLERGRRLYHKKAFPEALKAFTEAVNVSSEHLLVNALDSRAATFEKLDQLQPALRDAKKMIEVMPNLSKGYLRCGKVLQLKGETELALKIYDRGLTKVKIGTDKDRSTLQTMYNKLRQAQNPGKSRDPLQYLPLELAQIICENLEMRDRVICLAVSRPWKKLLESSHKLWTTLDTTYARKPISMKSLQIHFRRSNWALEQAIITMKASVDGQKLHALTKYCKKLKEIQLHGRGIVGDTLDQALPDARNLENLFVSRHTEIGLATVQRAFKSCESSLKNVTILNVRAYRGGFVPGRWPEVESMEKIQLQSDSEACLDFHGLRSSTPNVTSAILTNWKIMPNFIDTTPWTKLQYLDLTATQLAHLPKFPPTLRHLILCNNPQLRIAPGGDEEISLPLLETLDCSTTDLDAAALKLITRDSIKNGNLKKLDIGGRLSDFRPADPVEDEYPASDTVEELSLSYIIINDQRLIQVMKLYPKLQRLDVSGTKVTGVAVKVFVEMGIKWLGLNRCDCTSSDAIDWAREKGVEVECNNNPIKVIRENRFVSSYFANMFGD